MHRQGAERAAIIKAEGFFINKQKHFSVAGLRRRLDVTDSMYWQATGKTKRTFKDSHGLQYQPKLDTADEAEEKRRKQAEQDKEELLFRIGQAVGAADKQRMKQRAKFDAEAARQLAARTKEEQRVALRKQQEAQ